MNEALGSSIFYIGFWLFITGIVLFSLGLPVVKLLEDIRSILWILYMVSRKPDTFTESIDKMFPELMHRIHKGIK